MNFAEVKGGEQPFAARIMSDGNGQIANDDAARSSVAGRR